MIDRVLSAIAALALSMFVAASGIGCGSSANRAAGIADAPVRVWVTDSAVNKVLEVGGTVYAGGTFTTVGEWSGALAEVSRASAAQSAFPRAFGGGVDEIVRDGRGGWFVSGSFSHLGSGRCSRLAHVLASRVVDSRFCPMPDGTVTAMVSDGRRLILAGRFRRIGGLPRRGLAMLAVGTGRATGWAPRVGGRPSFDRTFTYPYVSALALKGGTVYVGGFFERIGGYPRQSLAAFDVSTGKIKTWDARLAVRDPNRIAATVGQLVIRGSILYVLGDFDSSGGAARAGLAAVDTTTGAVLGWAPVAGGGSVSQIFPGVASVYLSGDFHRLNSARRDGIGAVDPVTGHLTAWHAKLGGNSPTIFAANDRDVVVSREVEAADGRVRHLDVLDARTGALRVGVPNPNNYVSSVVFTDRGMLLGGGFSSLGGVARPGLAAFDAQTGRLLDWPPRRMRHVDVSALATDGSRLFVGGSFGGDLFALDLHTGKRIDWRPQLDPGFQIGALALRDGRLLVGGSDLVAIDLRSGRRLWQTNLLIDHVVALAAAPDRVFVGGALSRPSSPDAQIGLAAVDYRDGHLLDWRPGDSAYAQALLVRPRSVFVGGAFERLGNTRRREIAELDQHTAVATAWNARLGSLRFHVAGLALLGRELVVAGGVDSVQGEQRPGLASFSVSNGALSSWKPRLPCKGEWWTLAASKDAIAAGSWSYCGTGGAVAIFPLH